MSQVIRMGATDAFGIPMIAAAALFVALMFQCAERSHAKEYFVSPKGSDTGSGRSDAPFATIRKAASVLTPGDRCILRGGVYREVLRPEQSGRPGQVITFSSYRGEQVIISGADAISDWTSDGNGIFSASMPWTMPNGNQVFLAGKDPEIGNAVAAVTDRDRQITDHPSRVVC